MTSIGGYVLFTLSNHVSHMPKSYHRVCRVNFCCKKGNSLHILLNIIYSFMQFNPVKYPYHREKHAFCFDFHDNFH